MKILVVGSGGREHAIVDALAHSPKVKKIFAAPGNGGIREQAELVSISADDISRPADLASRGRIDLTFVGPEIPPSKGIGDALRERGLAIGGPDADPVRLAASKTCPKHFSK